MQHGEDSLLGGPWEIVKCSVQGGLVTGSKGPGELRKLFGKPIRGLGQQRRTTQQDGKEKSSGKREIVHRSAPNENRKHASGAPKTQRPTIAWDYTRIPIDISNSQEENL
jgi:hypothetical protein